MLYYRGSDASWTQRATSVIEMDKLFDAGVSFLQRSKSIIMAFLGKSILDIKVYGEDWFL